MRSSRFAVWPVERKIMARRRVARILPLHAADAAVVSPFCLRFCLEQQSSDSTLMLYAPSERTFPSSGSRAVEAILSSSCDRFCQSTDGWAVHIFHSCEIVESDPLSDRHR